MSVSDIVLNPFAIAQSHVLVDMSWNGWRVTNRLKLPPNTPRRDVIQLAIPKEQTIPPVSPYSEFTSSTLDTVDNLEGIN